jgi:hypothetical protein
MSGFNARLGLTVGNGIAVIDAAGNVSGPTITATTQFSGPGTGLTGTAPSLTAGFVSTNANLTGDVTSIGNATTLSATVVMGKPLTGYALGTNAAIAATDSIVQAFGKLQAQVTAAAALQTITLTGDVTGSGTGSFATTLANSGVVAGTYNNAATTVTPFTVDAKGRITGVGAAVTIAPLWSSIGSKPTTLAGFGITDAVNSSLVGVASGLATLDSSGKVPLAQLPASITGALNYVGTWNASTNSPTLTSGVGTKGQYYKVSVAGTTSIDGNANWTVGDLIIFDGTVWEQVQGGAESVVSVAGKTGAVTLAVTDVSGAAPLSSPALTGTPTAPTMTATDNSTSIATTAFVKSQNYITSAGAPVQSVNGSTGAVVLTTTNITEGSNLYFTTARVLASPLTGLTTTSGGAIAATDTIIAAFGKLENRMATNDAKVSYPGAPSWSQVTSKPTTLAGYAVTASDVTAQLLTGFSATAGGAVTATDSILAGLQKHEYRIAAMVTGVSSVNTLTGAVTLTTANVGENTNLYFTNARAIGATLTGFSATAGGAIAATDSILTGLQKHEYRLGALVTGVSSVNTLTGAVTLTTANVAENTNLYYTQARFDTAFAAKSTTNLSEGTNLYYTQARFDTAFAAKTTANLSENTNLYFTNARAIAAPLTGLSTATGGTVVATDSILVAIGKLEYRTALNDAKISYPGGTKVDSFNTRTGAVTLTSSDVTTALTYTPANAALIGAASGIASLGADGKVPVAQLPAGITGAMVYMGTWNASTNSPTLASGVGTKGYYYKVATAGSTSIDGLSNWTVGDIIVFNGSTWDQIQGGTSDVSSVFGRVGAVTLQSSDVTGALGFTPYNATNPSNFISGITSSMVTTALGFTPVNKAGDTGIGNLAMSGLTVTGQGSVGTGMAASYTQVLRLQTSGSSAWWLGVGDASGSNFTITCDFGSVTINKSTGTITTPGGLSSNGVSTSASISSTVTTGGNVLNAVSASTAQKFIQLANTGGSLYVGIESSTAGSFFPSSGAYDSTWYSPNNNSTFKTPLATFTGQVTATQFNGSGTGLTGTAASLTAGNVSAIGGYANNLASAVQSGTISALVGQDTNGGISRYNLAAAQAFGLITTSNIGSQTVTFANGANIGLVRNVINAPAYLDATCTATNFRTKTFGSSTAGYQLTTSRWNTGIPTYLSGLSANGTMISWAGSDTHGFLALDYNAANVRIGGGNADAVNWTATLITSANIGSQSVSYASYVGFLNGRTDNADYPVLWGADQGGGKTYAFACNGVTINSANNRLTASQLSFGGGWTIGSGAWAGSAPASTNASSTSGIYNALASSQLFTFSSGNGQCSIQTDGSLFVGDSIGYNPIGANATSDGYVVAANSISAGGYVYGAQGFQSNNVGGTGSASYHPGGVYSAGTNWLYGQIITNNNAINAGTGAVTCGNVNASGYVRGNYIYNDNNYGYGAVGLYNSSRSSLVYAMGDSYKGAVDGTSLTGGYGIWRAYDSSPGGVSGLGHQYLIVSNGSVVTALGTGIYTAGNVMATGDVIAYYSDERLKTDIALIQDPIAKVMALRGVTFRPNEVAREAGYTDTSEQVGVIAQDVAKVFPQLVAPAPFDIGPGGTSKSGNNYITVKYERLTAVLIEAVKEQQHQIESQKALIEAQQAQINELFALLRK